jgi:hypothetical protein
MLAAALVLAGISAPTQAETAVRVIGPHVLLGDVVPGAPAELSEIELCKAPPPGASRLLTRREVKERLRTLGASAAGVSLPSVVRVETRAERWSAAEISQRSTSIIQASLPPGVELRKVRAAQGAVVPVGTSVRDAKPHVPRRAGTHEVSAMAELEQSGEVVARIPLSLTLDVTRAALEPAIPRGASITVFVQRGNARVGATASALSDAELGDSAWFKVFRTGKVVKALVESKEQARLVEP